MIKKFIKAVVLFIFILTIAMLTYLNTSQYKADTYALGLIDDDNYIGDKDLVYQSDSNVGFIFYSGGKVSNEAYSYLGELANHDINVFIPKLYQNIAFFNKNIAKKIINENPQIEKWYVGGHSLGGVVSIMFASENVDIVDGVILFASYPSKDISDLGIEAISFYGSNDAILPIDEANEKSLFLPNDSKIVIIEDGNHSFFGNYGHQKGDNISNISNLTQQDIIIENIIQYLN